MNISVQGIGDKYGIEKCFGPGDGLEELYLIKLEGNTNVLEIE